MFTIPSHEWFMALFYPHYCYCYYHHMFNQQNLLQSLVTQLGVNGSDVDETVREMVVQGPSGTLEKMRLASPTK
jgi:hypothetical protein